MQFFKKKYSKNIGYQAKKSMKMILLPTDTLCKQGAIFIKKLNSTEKNNNKCHRRPLNIYPASCICHYNYKFNRKCH